MTRPSAERTSQLGVAEKRMMPQARGSSLLVLSLVKGVT